MILPKLNVPTFDTILPSSEKLVRFRPFLVEEEELLLTIQEGLSGSEESQQKTIVNAMCQILENCILEPKLDIRALPTFDIEFLFIQLRAKSIGEKLDLYIKGTEGAECKRCQQPKKVSWDLTEIKVVRNPKHNKKIPLGDSIGIVMKYPTIDLLEKVQNIQKSTEYLKIVARCIESVYDIDKVYPAKEVSEEEILKFLKGMTKKQFQKVKDFFDTMPKISHEVHWKCPDCGKEQTYVLEGAENFFG